MSRVLTGKWKWNDSVYPLGPGGYATHFQCEFESNGQAFIGIRFHHTGGLWTIEYDTGTVMVRVSRAYYEDDYCDVDPEYRIMDFGDGGEVEDSEDAMWLLSNITRCGTVAEKIEQIAENERNISKTYVRKDANGNIPLNDDETFIQDRMPVAVSGLAVKSYIADLVDDRVLEAGESANSIQQSDTGSLAGVKGFYWTESVSAHSLGDGRGYYVSLKLAKTTFDEGSVEPTESEIAKAFAIGDTLTIHAGSKFDKAATVEGIYADDFLGRFCHLSLNVTAELFAAITKSENNEYKAGMGFSDNAIFCPAKADKGIVDLGKYAFAVGEGTKALNYGATAFGRDTEAYGQYSTTVGRQTRAGYAAFASGRYAYADGENSVATGLHVKATAQGAHAEGGTGRGDEADWTQATEPFSHAEGESTKAKARACHVEGYFTEGTSLGGHVQGRFNVPGDYAHIVGNGTKESPANIHTVDWGGKAWYKGNITTDGDVFAGTVSLKSTNATASSALAKAKEAGIRYADMSLDSLYEGGLQGLQAKQTARYGLALGWGCEVTGDHGMAFGACTWAKGGQTAVGKANDPDKTYGGYSPIFMVGNGQTNAQANATTRSNAFVVTSNGTGYLGDKKIATEDDIGDIKTILDGILARLDDLVSAEG